MNFVTKNCLHCSQPFTRKSYLAKIRSFCSKQCSIASRIKVKDNKIKRKSISECTLQEVVNDKKGASRYTAVRSHARTLYKHLSCCEKCGYNKHVEICHIQAIHTFELDTEIRIINDRSNILILCPNCHWEFDHPASD